MVDEWLSCSVAMVRVCACVRARACVCVRERESTLVYIISDVLEREREREALRHGMGERERRETVNG